MKKNNLNSSLFITLFLMMLMMMGCSTANKKIVFAVVDQEVISEKDVNNRIAMGDFENKDTLYAMQKKELTRLVIEKLLEKEAKKKKITISELLAKNVYQKIKPTLKKDIKKYYEEKKNQFKNVKFLEAQKIIEDLIYRERKRDAFSVYYNELINKGKVHILLPKS